MSTEMQKMIAHVALVVEDYDDAIDFYVDTLGFDLLEDTHQPEENKRWVRVAPKAGNETSILLAKAKKKPEQLNAVGNQTGGRVFMFLQTDDFWRDYKDYLAKGVKFVREPKEMPYGTVAVFADLYGNLWDLLEYK